MPGTTNYPGANRTAQWFADDLPGVIMSATPRLVIHTTEGGHWPSYRGGLDAPTMTVLPDPTSKRFKIRQHFPLDMSARALENLLGGVDTNKLGTIQVELVGHCEVGKPGMHWPSAPEWARQELARVIATLHELRGVPLVAAPEWPPFPSSYGRTSARFTGSEWTRFKGVCGHMHVPENEHGDPGSIDITDIMARAKKLAAAPSTPTHEDDEMLSPEALSQLRTVVDAVQDTHDDFMIKNRDATVGRQLSALQTSVATVGSGVASLSAEVAKVHQTHAQLSTTLQALTDAVESIRAKG